MNLRGFQRRSRGSKLVSGVFGAKGSFRKLDILQFVSEAFVEFQRVSGCSKKYSACVQ